MVERRFYQTILPQTIRYRKLGRIIPVSSPVIRWVNKRTFINPYFNTLSFSFTKSISYSKNKKCPISLEVKHIKENSLSNLVVNSFQIVSLKTGVSLVNWLNEGSNLPSLPLILPSSCACCLVVNWIDDLICNFVNRIYEV